MKSWISFMLPKDEYQQKRILFFLAESGILLLFLMIILIFLNWRYPVVDIELGTGLILFFGCYIVYFTVRHSISGIEYADIISQVDVKKQRKRLLIEGVFCNVLFLILSLSTKLSLVSLIGVNFVLLFRYVSIKKSYNKNKELL